MVRTKEKQPYWTFEGVKIHYKNGTTDTLDIMIVEKNCPLCLPRKNYCGRRKVAEEVHDFLYNMKRGDEISWVELLNIKEYK